MSGIKVVHLIFIYKISFQFLNIFLFKIPYFFRLKFADFSVDFQTMFDIW